MSDPPDRGQERGPDDPPGSEDLRILLAVQEHDTALDRLRHRRQALAERVALNQVQQRRAELEVRRAEVEGRLTDLSRGQARLESDIASVGQRISDIERRLYGGRVSASRELQAMAAEVESLQRRRADLENRAIEVMELSEPVEAEVAAMSDEQAGTDAAITRLRETLAVAERAIDAAAAVEYRAREELAARLPPDIGRRYDGLRARLGGVGAARLINGCCQGCHLQLPATELHRLRHLPPGTVATCDQCGRILVP